MVTRNPKNFEFKLGKQGLLLFVVGMSLLLFITFLIGLVVGAHIDAYPEKIAQSIPAILRRQFSHPPVANEKTTAMKDEDRAAPVADDGNVVAASPPDAAVTGDATPAVTKSVEEKKSHPAALPAPDNSKTEPVPAAIAETPSVEAVRQYSIQVGSFKSEKAANRFATKITPLGYKPRVEMVALANKGNWFRIMVDGFASRAEARQAADNMAKKIKGVNGIIRPRKVEH